MLNPTKTLEVIDALNKTVVVVLDGFRLFIHVKPNQIISRSKLIIFSHGTSVGSCQLHTNNDTTFNDITILDKVNHATV